jgi:uncharacterized protein YerC
MSKPKNEIRSKAFIEESDELYELLKNEAKDVTRLKKILSDLLTEAEIRMLKRRWFVANLINSGNSVRQAAETAGVGTDTVMRVVVKIRKGTGVLKEILFAKAESQIPIKNKNKFSKKKENKSIKWFFGVK